MRDAYLTRDAEDALELFIGATIGRAEDLYDLDGEIAFRRHEGRIETFDAEYTYLGGQP
jgi:hypothetical protein